MPGEPNQASGVQRRERVRLALKRAWEREARAVFTGWQTCQDEAHALPPPHTVGPRRPGTGDENVKIHIQSSGGGQNPAHGSWGDHQQSGVLLNLHTSQAEIEYLAIHEFGHVLGFYHEEERSDWPSTIPGCPPQTWPPTDPWWPVPTELRWGAPDRNSVMAYCAGMPTALSPNDVTTVQHAYGRHLSGTLLSLPAALCLSGHANAANGENVFGWACDEAYDDQEWHYEVDRQALFIEWPSDPSHKRRCLDLDTTNNQDVQIWDCHYGANQQWQFPRGVIRGYGGLCLTRSASGALTMQTCTADANQLWQVAQGSQEGYVRLQSFTSDLCLTRMGGSGSLAVAQPCVQPRLYLPLLYAAGSALAADSQAVAPTATSALHVQDFLLSNGGKIVNISSPGEQLCLDVHDVWDSQYRSGSGGPAAGQNVQFFNCTQGQFNQQWSYSGTVRNGPRCLELSGGALNNGATAFMARCSGAGSQQWDYDW